MNALLIRNPGSRSGRGKQLWSYWESILERRQISFDAVTTEGRGHAVDIVRQAEQYDTVVAVGGDGTINEVLDGVMQSGRDDLKMGVLYCGTSPDFCKFHNIPVDPAAALDTLARGISKEVDVVRIAYTAAKSQRVAAHFGCSCNIGLGHAVAALSNRLRRWSGDLLGTCMAAVHSIATMKPVDLEFKLDGEELQLPAVNNLSILKNPHIASGLHLDLDLQPADGRLVLCGIHGKGKLALLSLLPAFYSGKATECDGVFIRECRRLSVASSREMQIEFDGDPQGFLPVEIDLLHRSLNLIV